MLGMLLIFAAIGPQGCQAGVSSPAQVRACQQQELKKEDDWLNDVYRRLISESSPRRQTELRNKQRTWIRSRDATCGRDTPCLTRLTKKRADQLEAMLGHL